MSLSNLCQVWVQSSYISMCDTASVHISNGHIPDLMVALCVINSVLFVPQKQDVSQSTQHAIADLCYTATIPPQSIRCAVVQYGLSVTYSVVVRCHIACKCNTSPHPDQYITSEKRRLYYYSLYVEAVSFINVGFFYPLLSLFMLLL